MQNLTQPTLLLKPFAESGDKNSIPVTNTDAQNPQLADLTNGFPQVTSDDPDDGGLPPERKDINGLGYLTTTYDYFYQAGGTFTYNPTISSAIGGYPLGARLWYTDGNGATTVVRSTVANNTDNFNDGQGTGIGTTWVPEIPALGWNNTWTGTNTFTAEDNAFRRHINLKTNYALGTIPATSEKNSVDIRDNTGTFIGGFEHWYYNDGSVVAQLGARKQDKSDNYATFSLGYYNNGEQFADASGGVKSSIVSWSMPNYGALTAIASGYSAPVNGFLLFSFPTRAVGRFTIGGYYQTFDYNYNNTQPSWVCYPVAKGQVVSFSGCNVYFAPCGGNV